MRGILTSVTLLCTLASHAQIGEWIADQIKEEIMNQIGHVTNTNSKNLGSFGTFIWDSVVEAKCESDLKEKAAELNDFKIDDSYLRRLPGTYPNHSKYWVNYADLSGNLYNHANSYFHQKNAVPFSTIANAKINDYAESYINAVIDSVAVKYMVVTLDSILNQAAIDSLRIFNNSALNDSLLNDIIENRYIAHTLNNHPEAVRVYYNSLNAPSMRKDPRHLYYWAVKADSYRRNVSKKLKINNPRNLRFVENGSSVEIINGKNVLARISDNKIEVSDINIMNYNGRPNTTYIFNNNTWLTDHNGRVIKAIQSCSKDIKKKCKQKKLLDAKDIRLISEADKNSESLFLNSPDFGAPEVLMNVVFYDKNKSNKATINAVKKARNEDLKKLPTTICNTDVTYRSFINRPSVVNLGTSYCLINSGITEINQAPTLPEIKAVMTSLDKNKVKPEHKIEFVKPSAKLNHTTSSNYKSVPKNTSTQSRREYTSAMNSQKFSLTLEGDAAGKYPILMQVNRNSNGSITGRYAYQSTLNNQGADDPSSWLNIRPNGSSTTDYTITDSKGDVQERWHDGKLRSANGTYSFAATVINAKGKTFRISAQTADAGRQSIDTGGATSRYKKKYDEVHIADIHLIRADGKKIWYNYWTSANSSGYDQKLYIYDRETDRETSIDLNKTSMEYMQVKDMVDHNGIISIIMEENRNSNGWIEGTYVWQYNCYTGKWTPVAKACSGAEFVNNRSAVKINNASCINPEEPTYLQRYTNNYTTIKL